MTEIDPWKVAKAAAEDHYLPRMDGTVSPKYVQQAFIDGFAGALERLPSRDEIAATLADGYQSRYSVQDRLPVNHHDLRAADAVLALIRKRFEEEQ